MELSRPREGEVAITVFQKCDFHFSVFQFWGICDLRALWEKME